MLAGLFIILGCGCIAWGFLEHGKTRTRLIKVGLLLLAAGIGGAYL